MRNVWRAAAATAVFSFACGAASAQSTAPAEAVGTVAQHYGTWGVDLTGRDPTVKPGTDFYLYANGNWLKRTNIPADKTEYGNFDKLSELSQNITRKLIEDAAAGRSKDRDAVKVGDAYHAYMDEARVEQVDAKPLAGPLDAVRAEKTKADVAALMGTANESAQSSIFGVGIEPDSKAPDRYAVSMGVSGMGLPDRDYYLNDQFAAKKAAYQLYIAKMLGMINWPEPEANAKALVELETKFAEASWPRDQQRDPDKLYNPMTPDELIAYAPGFDFKLFLKNADLGGVNRVILGTNTAFPKVAKIIDATPLDTLKAWQAFHLTSSAAGLLSKRFADAEFDFYGRTLSGQQEMRPRWKRAVGFVNGALNDSIGRMYVAENFPPESKAKIDAMVRELLAAMKLRIAALDWMSPATKAKAQEKLAKITLKIGYPVKWRDYSPLKISADDLAGNALRAGAYQWNYQVQRLNKPVDKEEWVDQAAQQVNAGYDPNQNDLTFPAAILQPPFFDPKADPAVNYGGIGAVIGHEITHAFDDQGRKYDGDGYLKEWWTAEDATKFQTQADRLATQYDKFEPVKGYFVNGQLTLGENIADLGGLLLAIDAYHASLNGKPAPALDGLTGDQRLFLSYAQIARTKVRDDAAIMAVKTDVHAPGHFRTDGSIRNVADWYAAFNITPGDTMYIAPEQRVHIW